MSEDTDWRRIVAVYDQLAAKTQSPIVELNRAVAIAFADGPAAGLAIVDERANLPALEAITSCRSCALTVLHVWAAAAKRVPS
jgi:predicted RNA polymerase sigma factor